MGNYFCHCESSIFGFHMLAPFGFLKYWLLKYESQIYSFCSDNNNNSSLLSVFVMFTKFLVILFINLYHLFNEIFINASFNFSMTESVSYRNQSIDFLCKSVDWFLCDRNLHHERVN